MAVVHIPEDEAVKDFRAVLGRLDEGNEIVIDRKQRPVKLSVEGPERPLTVREAINILKHRGNSHSGDETFADDIEFAMKRLRSVPAEPSPWD